MFFLKELPTKRMLETYARRYPEMNRDAVEEALWMLRRASLLIRELEAYFATYDLSQLRFLIMIAIDREPDRDGLSVSEIAERLDVSKPVMTRTLQSLIAADLVQLCCDMTDKRLKIARLTAAGAAKLAAIMPGYFMLIDDFMRRAEIDAAD